MSTTEITKENFEGVIEKNDVVVLDCWASWCGPCRTFAPVFEAAATRHPGVLWGKLDTESQPELASGFGIRSIPTVMVFRQGILLFQQPGMLPAAGLDEIVAKVQALDMEEIRQKIAEHEKAHADGTCNHDHGHGHTH